MQKKKRMLSGALQSAALTGVTAHPRLTALVHSIYVSSGYTRRPNCRSRASKDLKLAGSGTAGNEAAASGRSSKLVQDIGGKLTSWTQLAPRIQLAAVLPLPQSPTFGNVTDFTQERIDELWFRSHHFDVMQPVQCLPAFSWF